MNSFPKYVLFDIFNWVSLSRHLCCPRFGTSDVETYGRSDSGSMSRQKGGLPLTFSNRPIKHLSSKVQNDEVGIKYRPHEVGNFRA